MEQAVRAAKQWNERLAEHRSSIPETAAEIEQLSKRSPAADPNERKREVSHRKKDEREVYDCITIANGHIRRSQKEAGVFRAADFFTDEQPTNPAEVGQVFRVFSNARPMSQFTDAKKKEIIERAAQQHQTVILEGPVNPEPVVFPHRQEVDLHFLDGDTVEKKMQSLFEESRRYYNTKIMNNVETPLVMPTDSSHFIAKLLVIHQDDRPFRACAHAALNMCQSTLTLKHPAASNKPLIAYYSEQDYFKVAHGTPLPPNMDAGGDDGKVMEYENVCEFCYRAWVADEVQKSKYNNHKVTSEVPKRYYQTGPGEYSQEGMYQQAQVKRSTFTHGILGNMRKWSKADFIPCMLLFSPDNMKILECIHYDDYIRRREQKTLAAGKRWIPAWKEIGPFYAENEATLRQVKQTNPYCYAFLSTAREPSVGTLLEDYFSRQTQLSGADNWDYAHLFRDLVDCWNDPTYLSRNCRRSKNGRWKGFCLHQFDSPPPQETHKLYYIVLMKITTLRRLVDAKNKLRLTGYIIQKIRVYISSYHHLLSYLESVENYSDDALLTNLYAEPRLGVYTSAVSYVYPHPIYHHRNADWYYYKLATHKYTRNDPLTNCLQFYAEQAETRKTQPESSLHALPNAFSVDENYEAIVNQLGPVATLEHYEEAVQEAKEKFNENILAIKAFGINFPWKECTVKKQRKQSLKQDLQNANLSAKKHQKQKKAVVRTLRSICESVHNNFKKIENWVAEKTTRYLHLLSTYGDRVLCSFSQTLKSTLDYQKIYQDLRGFAHLIPEKIKSRLRLSETEVNGTPWRLHRILFSLLMRVAVLEELHALEPYDRLEIRHNLILLRNSHLKLFRKIIDTPDKPLTDAQLHKPLHLETQVTVLEFYFPHPERELHEGSLPNYASQLEMVDFYSISGMDQFPWNKLQYKMPDRCCRVRDFSTMLRNLCQDRTFYRWTLLVLRISLCGLYKHSNVTPCFARTVGLDELFDESLNDAMKPTLIQFILRNESVVLNAMSESLCYQLEMMPSLLNILNTIYRDWFSWRIRANMDMTRYLFNLQGTFRTVENVVFDRVHLKSMRTIFRLSETDFVIWICSAFKYADDNRHKSNKPCLPPDACIDEMIDTVIQNLILQLDPNQKIDVRVLTMFGIEMEQLQTLSKLYSVFLVQNMQATDQTIPPELEAYALSSKKLVELIHTIPPEQYVIMWHFFTLLKNYQAVRVVQIRNAAVLDKQWQRIQEKTGAKNVDEVPRFSFCLAFSLCCKHVKNSWSSKPGVRSEGFEDIFYNLDDNLYVCAKKPHGALENEEGQTTTSKRKIDRELRRPVCARTEPFPVSLLGNVIEADGYKIPGTKRAALVEGNVKKPNFELPVPGYWIPTCCGNPFEYDADRETPAGYQCRFCLSGIAMYNSFLEVNCMACRLKIGNQYYLHKVYDDIYEMQPRRVVFCNDCQSRVRRIVGRYPLLSFLLKTIRNKEDIADLITD